MLHTIFLLSSLPHFFGRKLVPAKLGTEAEASKHSWTELLTSACTHGVPQIGALGTSNHPEHWDASSHLVARRWGWGLGGSQMVVRRQVMAGWMSFMNDLLVYGCIGIKGPHWWLLCFLVTQGCSEHWWCWVYGCVVNNALLIYSEKFLDFFFFNFLIWYFKTVYFKYFHILRR